MGLVDGMIYDPELGSREYILSFISCLVAAHRERERERERGRALEGARKQPCVLRTIHACMLMLHVMAWQGMHALVYRSKLRPVEFYSI